MKKIIILIILVWGVSLSNHLQAQWITGTSSDSMEIKYIAKQLKNPNVYVGVFDMPAIGAPRHKMKSGQYPERMDGYDKLRQAGILKLYTQNPDANFDSVIFIDNPTSISVTDESATFYSFPGTTWLLFLKKTYNEKDGVKKASGWMKGLENYDNIGCLTPNSSYTFANPHQGSYYLGWNKQYQIPENTRKINKDVADEVIMISRYVKSLPANLSQKDFNEKIKALTDKVKTKEGKLLMIELMSN
ncbi:MAG: hypothetical protein NTX03_06340 [Bacteroidetes bacterium]|nr:hypothetical protein [Bacteroidota bacterium]